MCAPTSKLLLKSMPCSIEELAQLIQEVKLIIPRSLNSFGRRRALLEYADPSEAQEALEQLIGLSDKLDKPLRISNFGPRDDSDGSNKPKIAHKSTQASAPDSENNNKKYVQKLYAGNKQQFDLMQPPPPYLQYAYPPINDNILAAIGDALRSDKRFYTQVLHLMNRMNLRPPFGKRPSGLHLLPEQSQSIATQTEKVLESETESELESDEEAKLKQQQLKRKPAALATSIPEQYRKRARQMLQSAVKAPIVKVSIDVPTFDAPKIELKLPTSLPAASTDEQLPEERLTLEQLQALPIYKNYKRGEPSNKLYIKNLDKSVMESQLRLLYARYAPADSLDIKVMQQGRMKGQAFITFQKLSNTDTIADADAAAVVVAQALMATNGLLWHQKPMIVCYGKQQQEQT
ncbi:GH20545 [Drosophila grimshawi]|uniref:GH20545 n=1 Tax=Drosophila grimshawi TaxID=7222 RepID=B4J8K5_DROGR|nr:GH20545 [Drosophila grimshawi]